MISIEGQKLAIQTQTVEACFDGPAIVSVRGRDDPVEFIHPKASAHAIDLFYLNGNTLGQDKHQTVSVCRLSSVAARIVVKGEDSQRSLLVAVDEQTGDIRVTPNGISNRRGLQAVGWRVPIHPEATVILPVVNGMRIPSDAPHPPSARFPWPFKWEAQLAIAQRGESSMMIHCEDRAMQFKALRLIRKEDRTELCFEGEPPGPLWENRTAGGLEWRINVYRGEWKAPAKRYRDWMAKVYDLADKRRTRPAWVERITLAMCWCPANELLLDRLAAAHPPDETLIHLSHHWRTEKYDVNYPDYTPSEQGLKFAVKAREMGFHVMPHFNYWAVYYKHPFYQQVRDFQIRSVTKNEPEGWHWPPDTHDYTRMAYIHPGLGIWRNKLIDVVLDVCNKVGTDAAFIDQTLCTWNTDNGLVEGMNTIEGLRWLQEEFATVRPGLVLIGEGLNEISFQRQCFAQAHIHEGWGKLEPKHVEAAHPICSFLWAGHAKLIGYHHLSPTQEGFELGIELYERMSALPTIITGDPKDLKDPSPEVKRILDRAKQERSHR